MQSCNLQTSLWISLKCPFKPKKIYKIAHNVQESVKEIQKNQYWQLNTFGM